MKKSLLTLTLALFALLQASAQPGAVDPTFNPGGAGANSTVFKVVYQTNGKILIGGNFTTYNGTSISRIARLNSDGTLDGSFNPGTGSNDVVTAIAVQSDGKILVGGNFTQFNGIAHNRLVRLNADGSIDATFNGFSGANGQIYSIVVQQDGNILVGGAFTEINGPAGDGIARLTSSGATDAGFATAIGTGAVAATVNDIGIQSDGKIIVGGNFTTFNGTAKNRILRLNSSGALDNAFTSDAGAAVFTLAVQSDDKIIIGGAFTTINATARVRIARLESNGNLDGNFLPGGGASNTVRASALQLTGDDFFIGGSFGTYSGTASPRIVKVLSSGSLDVGFPTGLAFDATVFSLATEPVTNKIVAAGDFTEYNENPVPARLVRLLNSNPLFVWTGGTSSAWNTPSNWSTNSLPGSNDLVIIGSGTPFSPVVSSAVEIIDLTVQSGANLTIQSGASMSLSGVLTNNGTITVQNNGSLRQGTTSTLAGTGTFSVKRDLPSSLFHYIGSPINNVAVNSFGITPLLYNGAVDGSQLVPLSTCSASALEFNSPWSNLLELRENANLIHNCSQSLWFVKSQGTLTNGRGYAARPYFNTTLNFSFDGTVNNGVVNYSNLTSTGGTVNNPGNITIDRGWHLVSNPYPSNISFGGNNGLLTGQGFTSQVQIWNPVTGQWIPSVSNSVIPVAQGFQIRNANVGTSPTLSFNNAMRTTTSATFYELPWEQFITVTLENEQHNMQTVVFFNEDATDEYDSQLEANRLFGDEEVPVIYTLAGNETEHMAFNAYAPLYNETKTVVMGVYDGITPGAFTLRFQDLSTIENTSVVLEDTKLNTFNPVNEDFVYNFTTASGDDRNRFRLHFSMLDASFIQPQYQNMFSVFPNPTDDEMNITFTDTEQSYTFLLTDLTGKVVMTRKVSKGTPNVQINTDAFANGLYMLEVRSEAGQTNVVKIVKK